MDEWVFWKNTQIPSTNIQLTFNNQFRIPKLAVSSFCLKIGIRSLIIIWDSEFGYWNFMVFITPSLQHSITPIGLRGEI